MINDDCSLLGTLLLAYTENTKRSPHPCRKEEKGYGIGTIKDLGMQKT